MWSEGQPNNIGYQQQYHGGLPAGYDNRKRFREPDEDASRLRYSSGGHAIPRERQAAPYNNYPQGGYQPHYDRGASFPPPPPPPPSSTPSQSIPPAYHPQQYSHHSQQPSQQQQQPQQQRYVSQPYVSVPLPEGPVTVNSRPLEGPGTYRDYSETKKLELALRGLFVLESFRGHEKDAIAAGGNIVPSFWNRYWAQFSEQFADFEQPVKRCLTAHQSSNRLTPGMVEGKLNRRRVVVKLPPVFAALSSEVFSEAIATLRRIAVQFGAIEHSNNSHDEFRVQFSTGTSALAFTALLRSTSPAIIFPQLTNLVRMTDSWMQVLLVEQRLSKPGGDAPTQLVLGNRLDIPTVFVNALFREWLDATDVQVMTMERLGVPPGVAAPQEPYFLISFPSYESAKYALHTLQRPLLEVFRATLAFDGDVNLMRVGLSL